MAPATELLPGERGDLYAVLGLEPRASRDQVERAYRFCLELYGEGCPATYTLLDPTDVWTTFQLREDKLAGVKMGGTIRVRVPALAGKVLDVRVFYIAPVGDFATWRATNAQGGFDLKTFEVRARPLQAVEGLRPGMSVLVVRGL